MKWNITMGLSASLGRFSDFKFIGFPWSVIRSFNSFTSYIDGYAHTASVLDTIQYTSRFFSLYPTSSLKCPSI